MSQGISWVIWEIQFNAPPHRVRRTAATASLILATIKASVPFGHWKTETFIAGLRHDGLVAPFVINCPMNRKIFEAYIETQLAPTLEPGDVVSRVAEQKHRARDDAIFDRGAKGIVHRQITTVSQTKHFAPAFIRIPAQTGQHDRGNGFVAGGIALFRPGKDLEEICPDQNHCELSDACVRIPIYPAGDSDSNPATHSDPFPATCTDVISAGRRVPAQQVYDGHLMASGFRSRL